MSVLLINLETGKTIEADDSVLRERGIPEGYRVADSISVEEWISALKIALSSK